MMTALMEAALRSLILALMVGAGLRIFRIRNVMLQRCAWTAVLLGSLLMPLALPFTARWQVLPAAMIPAPASLHRLRSALILAAPSEVSIALSAGDPAIIPRLYGRRGAEPTTARTAGGNLVHAASVHSLQPSAPGAVSARVSHAGNQFSWIRAAWLIYLLIAAALVFRLLFGLASALRLWHSSLPIDPESAALAGADIAVRFSRRVSTPVTIGSGVVLPAGYTRWPEEKLRMVLAHERSHVSLHDFNVQMLASLYAALAWFSPLGWWLKHKLSDLGEAISDHSGLKAASNRSAYAQVLLEFAAAPRPTLTGVAMARPSSVSRRIERLLNDRDSRRAFSGGARARVAVLVVPAVLFAAAALVRVHAATQADPVAASSNAGTLPPSPAAPVSRAVPGVVSRSATPSAPAAPPEANELARATPPEPPAVEQAGGTESEASFDRNLTFNGKLDLSVGTASGNITLTRGAANQIRIHGVVKANRNGDPAQVQQIAAHPPIEQDGNTIRIGGHGENLHDVSISYEIEAPADASLKAATASGDINDTGVGAGAKLIAASGNITATGLGGGFEIQTGSGNIAVNSTGQGDAKAQTGSGNIDVKGVSGALKAQTGSGTIKAAGTPSSPWKLQAGSGNIELATGNAAMDLDASTGSGSISANSSMNTQSSGDHHHLHTQLNGGGPEVRVETGSGDIHID